MSAKSHKVSEKEADAALQRLGQAARAQLLDSLTPSKEAEMRRRFRDSLTREVSRASHATSRRVARWAGATAGIAAVAAGAFFVLRTHASRPLTYEVDSPQVAEREYILVPPAAPSAHVHFSDGSELTVAPGGRGRIAALDAHGATIGLENGKASLHVVHREGTHWSVDAGPFAIAVTGTAFDVAWSGADEVFEVVLKSGSITVRGPLAAAGIQLGAGQKIVANLREGQLRIERFAPGPTAAGEGATGAVAPAESNPAVEWQE
jgi:ferric-dicitrate binding protein FerR (iron transport regulator)